MRPVASRVPTTPGMPYSRETIAACESRPPLSVTIPPSSGSRMLKASVVDAELARLDLQLRTVPGPMRNVSPAAYEAGETAGASLAINPEIREP